MRVHRVIGAFGLAAGMLSAGATAAFATTEPVGAALDGSTGSGVMIALAAVAVISAGLVAFGRERHPARVPARSRRR